MPVLKRGQQPLRCVYGCYHLSSSSSSSPRYGLAGPSSSEQSSIRPFAVPQPPPRQPFSTSARISAFPKNHSIDRGRLVDKQKSDRQSGGGTGRYPRTKQHSISIANAKKLVQQLRKSLRGGETETERELSPIAEDEQNGQEEAARQVGEPSTVGSDSPELEDLLRLRPRRLPRLQVYDPIYAKLYRKLYDSVENAFTQRQLRQLCLELGVKAGYRVIKRTLIPQLLESWGWKAPAPKAQPKLTEEQSELPIDSTCTKSKLNSGSVRLARSRALLISQKYGPRPVVRE